METKTNRHVPAKINQQEAPRAVIVSRLRAAGVLSSLYELLTRDHCMPMRTLVLEMNISITN